MNRPISPALQKLMAQFGDQLPDKLAEIRRLHEACAEDQDEQALQDYYTAVHRIAGSAGSYGFRAVSESARVLDRYLSDVLAGEKSYSPERAAELLAGIDQTVAQRDA